MKIGCPRWIAFFVYIWSLNDREWILRMKNKILPWADTPFLLLEMCVVRVVNVSSRLLNRWFGSIAAERRAISSFVPSANRLLLIQLLVCIDVRLANPKMLVSIVPFIVILHRCVNVFVWWCVIVVRVCFLSILGLLFRIGLGANPFVSWFSSHLLIIRLSCDNCRETFRQLWWVLLTIVKRPFDNYQKTNPLGFQRKCLYLALFVSLIRSFFVIYNLVEVCFVYEIGFKTMFYSMVLLNMVNGMNFPNKKVCYVT